MNVRCVSTSSGDSFFVAGVQSALKSILIKLSEITQLSMFVYLPSLCIKTVQGIRTQIVISNAPLRERRMDISDV